MATTSDLLTDGFDRIAQLVHRVLDGLDEDQLTARLDPDANSIGWLIWHLVRVQDDHVSELADTDQRWTAGGWARRFDLPFDDGAVGYGQSSDEVGQVRGLGADQLLGYADDVHRATLDYVGKLGDADLDRVVDTSYDPAVTVAIRLVSVISDDLQHAGQAAYVRGVLARRG